jgi:hypothetical protein
MFARSGDAVGARRDQVAPLSERTDVSVIRTFMTVK